MMAFEAKNKASFIDGSIQQPEVTYLLYGSWKRCNSMIKSWIMNSVSKDIAASLLYIRTASDVWKQLKDRFSQSNRPRVYKLKKSLSALGQAALDVIGYYTKLKTLWDKLHEY